MRIAISADSTGLEGVVSPHFGRCPFFVLVDLDGQEVAGVQSIENPYFHKHEPGQVPGFIRGQGANVMLTGGMGHRAIGFFEQYGIQPVTGASGTIRHALEQYLQGALAGAEPCLESQRHAHRDPPPEGAYEKDDVGRLREEAEALQRQLDAVAERLKRVDGGDR